MHVAPLVVMPLLPLGEVDVVSPQAHRSSDVPWLEVVPGAFEVSDLGKRPRGDTVDGGP
ncbi:hypothetical protein [Kitasatospora sp. NPDC057015]|uniref:hypothetical protein n=1 Tax=Kitasatospora sp. NPDC057015 TaxID=3346001 RepID=UPI0036401F65